MIDTTKSKKIIAKNTMLLYVRMLLTMAVSLYTSRIVLSTLGIEDYGIYNVVGGIVAMFSVISSSLSAAISRFITFELGKREKNQLENIFSTAVTIQLIISLIIIILAESIGIWFLNNKMNIPDNRLNAANWVFQMSILTFIINLISVPYNASIIAHEKMSAFAYISIFEVSAKLGIVYLLLVSPIDRLISYSILMALVALMIRMVYSIYCKNKFDECKYHFAIDKDLLKKMFSFAGWNFIGASAVILRDNGGNIIINIFCGPSVNAARGIASQVNSAIQGFVNNFMVALNPQITKSYANGDTQYMMELLFQGARLSFYLMIILSLPVIINIDYILNLWLKVVPEHTSNFVILVLIFAMSESISNPLITAMLATGKIRNYQLIVGGLQMLNLPISYLLLKLGYFPEIVLVVAIFISQLCMFARLYLLHNMIGLPINKYIKDVYLNIIIVSIFAVVSSISIRESLPQNFNGLILSCILCVIATLIILLYIGCNKTERTLIINKAQVTIKKILRHDKNTR